MKRVSDRLRQDFNGEPFSTAICRDVNFLCDRFDEFEEALRKIAAWEPGHLAADYHEWPNNVALLVLSRLEH